jgi:hypothetical protein
MTNPRAVRPKSRRRNLMAAHVRDAGLRAPRRIGHLPEIVHPLLSSPATIIVVDQLVIRRWRHQWEPVSTVDP